ncbi:PREDICTED: uncharacterized protein LOC106108491 [Papilio polytes]|uniref:uncharacterized protein LOC106108491 n=1 Tax=Papilio polytes TaxID=76194 RepID=UPI00067681C7|nr:PREDICTED: uncharacterized protein LOC106108491 [Papilio polytes]XP_013145122.1 PREDICTED: uncharacterized protein LOC106108491 [Papilio polytes]XP_013145123.1 PREDICTED: uncharacterized protein LOC106108491 [Papilio polytes]
MGILCSTFAGIDLCTSRLANWFLCFVTLGGIMSFMQISVIYGMTIGYHTGQEQLAYFAVRARNVQSTTRFSGPLLRTGTEVERRTEPYSPDTTTITTTSPPETTTESVLGLEMYETRPRTRTGSRDDSDTPLFIQYVDMTTLGSLPDLEDFPRKYNGRVRRAKNDILSKMFWRPFKKTDAKAISPK